MTTRKPLIVLVLLPFASVLGAGCSHELNDDWLALTQVQSEIIDTFLADARLRKSMYDGLIDKHFEMLEDEIERRERKQFLDPRTVPSADGVDRLLSKNAAGIIAAVPRADIERFFADGMAARVVLAEKKKEWQFQSAAWDKLINDVEEANQLNLTSAEDLHAALASAQRLADDMTYTLSGLLSSFAAYHLVG